MVVYADILIVLNMLVDYFLLLSTKRLLKRKTNVIRIVLASLEGGIFSLYIFLPQSAVFIELSTRMAVCFVMSLTAFKFINLKEFLKNSVTLFLITCLYAGVMTAVWKLFKPYGMVINNSVVYFKLRLLRLLYSFIYYSLFFRKSSHLLIPMRKNAISKFFIMIPKQNLRL